MADNKVPDEKFLQKWFEKAAKQNEICASIENIEELRAKVADLSRARRHSTASMCAALTRALHICEVLQDVRLIGANESIAPPDCSSMRPDVVLVTPAAQYLLIELKTKPEAERQGVQELLAYSTAIKLQAHHVNDFIYIIVANDWGTLLSYGVRAMMMDGKHVLPVQCSQTASGFSLRINLELFEFQYVRPYLPGYALSPATLAVQRRLPGPYDSVVAHIKLDKYFWRLALSARAECTRLQQSGFLMAWRHPTSPGSFHAQEMVNLTLFTVNQHWRAGEDTPAEHHPREQDPNKMRGLDGLHLRRYHDVYDAEMARHPEPEEDDFFADAARHEAAALEAEGIFPQSTFSADVLSRFRSQSLEQALENNRDWFGGFELGAPNFNLNHFFLSVPAWPGAILMDIWRFFSFGDVADFADSTQGLSNPTDFFSLQEYFAEFHRYKTGGQG